MILHFAKENDFKVSRPAGLARSAREGGREGNPPNGPVHTCPSTSRCPRPARLPVGARGGDPDGRGVGAKCILRDWGRIRLGRWPLFFCLWDLRVAAFLLRHGGHGVLPELALCVSWSVAS